MPLAPPPDTLIRVQPGQVAEREVSNGAKLARGFLRHSAASLDTLGPAILRTSTLPRGTSLPLSAFVHTETPELHVQPFPVADALDDFDMIPYRLGNSVPRKRSALPNTKRCVFAYVGHGLVWNPGTEGRRCRGGPRSVRDQHHR